MIKMKSNERKKMIQQGFDTVVAGYNHPLLSFFPETAKWLVGYLGANKSKELAVFERENREEIVGLLGEEGVWFNTGVLVGVGVGVR